MAVEKILGKEQEDLNSQLTKLELDTLDNRYW